MVRVDSSRNACRPAEDSGWFLPSPRTALQTSPLRFAPRTAPPPAAPAPPPLACPHCQGTDLRCIGRVERSGMVSLFARVILSRAAPAYADSS